MRLLQSDISQSDTAINLKALSNFLLKHHESLSKIIGTRPGPQVSQNKLAKLVKKLSNGAEHLMMEEALDLKELFTFHGKLPINDPELIALLGELNKLLNVESEIAKVRKEPSSFVVNPAYQQVLASIADKKKSERSAKLIEVSEPENKQPAVSTSVQSNKAEQLLRYFDNTSEIIKFLTTYAQALNHSGKYELHRKASDKLSSLRFDLRNIFNRNAEELLDLIHHHKLSPDQIISLEKSIISIANYFRDLYPAQEQWLEERYSKEESHKGMIFERISINNVIPAFLKLENQFTSMPFNMLHKTINEINSAKSDSNKKAQAYKKFTSNLELVLKSPLDTGYLIKELKQPNLLTRPLGKLLALKEKSPENKIKGMQPDTYWTKLILDNKKVNRNLDGDAITRLAKNHSILIDKVATQMVGRLNTSSIKNKIIKWWNAFRHGKQVEAQPFKFSAENIKELCLTASNFIQLITKNKRARKTLMKSLGDSTVGKAFNAVYAKGTETTVELNNEEAKLALRILAHSDRLFNKNKFNASADNFSKKVANQFHAFLKAAGELEISEVMPMLEPAFKNRFFWSVVVEYDYLLTKLASSNSILEALKVLFTEDPHNEIVYYLKKKKPDFLDMILPPQPIVQHESILSTSRGSVFFLAKAISLSKGCDNPMLCANELEYKARSELPAPGSS